MRVQDTYVEHDLDTTSADLIRDFLELWRSTIGAAEASLDQFLTVLDK